jgi:hypothetical protein
MNEKLPKPMIDALARQTNAAEHPSADVLAAFGEHSLAEHERDSVTEHLARCAECREVVFLASGAAEEAFAPRSELVAAAHPGGQSRLVAAQAMPQVAMAKPRKRWALRWVWAASGATVVALVGGVFVLPHFTAGPPHEVAMKSAPAVPSPSEKPEPETSSQAQLQWHAPQSSKSKPRPTPQPPTISKGKNEVSQTVEVTAAANNEMPLPRPAKEHSAAASPPKPADSAVISIGGSTPGALASSPRASGFAPNAGQAQQQLDALNTTVTRAVANYSRAQQSNWRISPQGQLEHLTSDGWTRMLADQPSAFRVVSVTGSNVWAGGNDGMLFHSADNGLHWDKVALANSGATETGTLLSIRFSDLQHGEVVSDSGASYATSDGGKTWTKQ